MAASAGRILLMPKGDYIDSTEYNILDIVRDGGKTWLCRQTCTGQTPSSNEYWFLLCQDGASGTIGSIWYRGTGITGTSETPTIFSGSGVALANVSDMYLNSTTGNVYQCTTGGNAATAEWVFVISLGGTASWAAIADKPFNTIGSNGLIVATDVLDVDLLKIERKASTLTSKAAVVLADEMVIADSADSSITKRSPFSALKTLFDTLYNNYVLPTATALVKGGIKIGNGLVIDSEIVRVDKYTFANVAVATTDFATYTASGTVETDLKTAGYDYKVHKALTGVTADHEANVVFGAIEADSGNYASVVTTEAGYVNIYAKSVPSSAITIPTIDCTYKGA